MIVLKPLQTNKALPRGAAQTNAPCDANSAAVKLALKTGDYAFLENITVYEDRKNVIKFSSDVWEFKKSTLKHKSIANLNFSLNTKLGANVISIASKEAERNFINQMKAFVLAVIYHSTEVIELSSLTGRVLSLRHFASMALRYGLNGFEDITEEMLLDWIADGFDLSRDWMLIGLNSLRKYGGILAFEMQLPLLTHKKLNIKKAEYQQNEVIPFRIWSELVNSFIKEVQEAYKHRHELQKLTEEILIAGDEAEKKRIRSIRVGNSSFNEKEKKRSSTQQFLAALNAEGINLIDYEQNDRWLQLFNENNVNLSITNHTKNILFKFRGRELRFPEAKEYLSQIWNVCSWLALLLSGMRIDELYALHPQFGAQDIELPIGHSLRKKETIYIFTTRQSKITPTTQKLDDTYVTTVDGYKAFHVLNALSAPYRAYIEEFDSDTMFVDLKRNTAHRQRTKTSLGKALSEFIAKRSGIDMSLTQLDLDNLSVSEGVQIHNAGEQYRITPHQTRRSIAYYLVGFELCSFPALKQQLGHFSMAMTRWYARNATKYPTFWKEVSDLRISEKADICVRIFKRLANGERLAGGKGAAYLKEIQNNPNYFEDGTNKRLLTKEYWEEKLRTGKQHIHAIAPSMYCSNHKCSMRLAIDLTECVDCEFDYIENVAYAESARMNAMYRLERLASEGELNPSVASSCYMTILASERIMKDLDFKYEPYEVPEVVKGLVIDFKVMA
ncbi:site-specific integrase [Vibrio harveyi]|uniref:site-specific integrase n=1 Tax=Vibrio harveyi TaxID=669 RepID=UPI0038CD3210